MSKDAILRIGGSKLQHGSLSKRVYLMHLEPPNGPEVLDYMHQLAEENGYTKLFAKIPGKAAKPFIDSGFSPEAEIPNFFPDGDEVLFLAKFLSEERSVAANPERLSRVLETAREKASDGTDRPQPEGYKFLELNSSDAERMAELYSEVFKTYPFPIFDPKYLLETMEENFRYFGAMHGNDLAAAASCEIDGGCVEMTDFATHPEHRSAGLAGSILNLMEEKMRGAAMKTAFTIARARSFGINILFSRAGYIFAGTLINNTGISGRMESMNIWYKQL